MKEFVAADLFCGAGGTSTGLVLAAEDRRVKLNLLAVNHWSIAVQTHTKNHPWARHMCADLSSIDPSKAIPGGRLDLLVASPECTHHSNARGGKPCSDQSRASAWHVLHWAERLRIDRILIENVKEFQGWGPLMRNGRPNKKRKGETFDAFVRALQSLGYSVEWRVLNAADYGDATCRHRLFIQASRSGKITWPVASHVGNWRAAAEIIDWNIPGKSIFTRKRPLKAKTLARIEAGLKKFGGEAFIAVLRGTDQSQAESWARGTDAPLGTITAGGGHQALCQVRPFLVEYHSPKSKGDHRVRPLTSPLPTATTENRFGLVQPFIMNTAHAGGDRVSGIDKPLPTIPAGHRGELAFIIPMEHKGGSLRSVEEPLPTITTAKGGAFGLAQPFLTKYFGTGGARPVDEPLDTITAKDRFALVEPGKMDILFRMLQPHELAKAMGFDGYEFAGTKTDQVKQIGNAVSVRTAKALCGEIMGGSRCR